MQANTLTGGPVFPGTPRGPLTPASPCTTANRKHCNHISEQPNATTHFGHELNRCVSLLFQYHMNNTKCVSKCVSILSINGKPTKTKAWTHKTRKILI